MDLTTCVVGVIGAGTMGRGIVQISAAAGFRVKVFDAKTEAAAAGAEFAAGMLRRAAQKGQLTERQAADAVDAIEVCSALEQLRGADLVVEAAAENLEIKTRLFAQLEGILDDEAIIASNTSSLTITQLASACRRPQRVAGLHFFNPVPLMKLVEVIPGLLTDRSTIDRLTAYAERVGHQAVEAADGPGFLVNHAGRAFYTEAVRIVSEGVADVVAVDAVARDTLGFRMGPFELFDHTGLDVSYPVLTQIYHQFFEEPRFRPHPLLTRQVAAGLYGKKTGRGFYAYHDGRREDPPPIAVEEGEPLPLWIDDSDGNGAPLRELFAGAGFVVDNDPQPHPGSVCVVAPWGSDATTIAARLGLPMARTVAIDPLGWPASRVTLMPTVATEERCLRSVGTMLARAGRSVTRIHDSAGFVAQRLLASVVNLACEIAQQRIASPSDIDRAVRLGLGYPHGPLAWGDRMGAARVLEILDGLHGFYGDPRYRPSPWLRRRALAGLSLLAPDP